MVQMACALAIAALPRQHEETVVDNVDFFTANASVGVPHAGPHRLPRARRRRRGDRLAPVPVGAVRGGQPKKRMTSAGRCGGPPAATRRQALPLESATGLYTAWKGSMHNEVGEQ